MTAGSPKTDAQLYPSVATSQLSTRGESRRRVRLGILSRYPLQRPFTMAGLVGGLCLAGISPLAGFALVVLLVGIAAAWRRDEPPAFVWCVGYKWLIISSSYLYMQVTGVYPGFEALGDIDAAVFLSLVSLLTLVAGYRVALDAVAPKARPIYALDRETPYEPRRIMWVAIATFGVGWFAIVSPLEILERAAQPIYHTLAFRDALLFALFVGVILNRRGYPEAVVVFLFAIVPRFTSAMSTFKEVVFLVFIALATAWRPWAREGRQRTTKAGWMAIALVPVLIAAGVVWEAGIKPVWRPLVTSGAVSGAPVERLGVFFHVAGDAVRSVDLVRGAESLIANLSSSTGFFSSVVERVPAVVPHQDGLLTARAVTHVLTPRLLFPDKPALLSDSWLIHTFAGAGAAGDESGTSIGLGYMAQFYIDFGWPLMLAPVFCLGLLIGAATRLLLRAAPSQLLGWSAVTVLLLHYASTIGEITKMFGSFLQATFVFTIILTVAGPPLHRFLQGRSRRTR